MREHRMVVDMFNSRLYPIWPGGYNVSLSLGSQVYELVEKSTWALGVPMQSIHREKRPTENPVVSATIAAEATPQR